MIRQLVAKVPFYKSMWRRHESGIVGLLWVKFAIFDIFMANGVTPVKAASSKTSFSSHQIPTDINNSPCFHNRLPVLDIP